jgi:hypothetical protein
VDCDDFTPPISALCEEPTSVPALGGWGRAIVVLFILAASYPRHSRNGSRNGL